MDYLADTPNVARAYCPTCEPDADHTAEVLDVRYCGLHQPSYQGVDDAGVRTDTYINGTAESGGDDNRRWCDLFHRS